jgi:chemotaxis protein methyltransferase CheR
VTPLDYDYLRGFLKTRSGLVLSNDKQYLIESRLMPIVRKEGLSGISELVQKLKGPGSEPLALRVTEAMTTNESFFFRDKTPFDHFKEVMMPALIKARAAKRHIRIWCAAASTGQEPYSLAMILKEMGPQIAGWRIEIIGTDLSGEVLDRAKAGVYTQFEVQRGLPIQYLLKHFTQNGDQWTISQEIRSMVHYRTLNLLNDFSALGTFDIVYCRNVLIYFDQPTKVDVLNRTAKLTAPDGYLLLGAAETVVGLTEAYKPVADRRGLYMPAAKAPVAAPAAAAGATALRPFALAGGGRVA